MSRVASFLSLHVRGYEDLQACLLVAVGEGGPRSAPSQDLLGAYAPSQVYLSRKGREECFL
jgi:hypothetical protein